LFAAAFAAAAFAAAAAHAQVRGNLFNDPFLQATEGFPGCPVPRGPYVSEEDVRVQGHGRMQMGGSCYRVGRCRLPNAYLYDAEIIPRVRTYLREEGRFDDTSVWLVGHARSVMLFGCVRSKEQAEAMEKAVMLVDDVLNVANYLMVGTQGKPPYRLQGDTTP
jgi:hypothetical protein